MYICMYVCMYACMYVYMYACMYVCMYICMYVCIYVCMYTYAVLSLQMVDWKNVHSSSPVRTPKLQLAAEQPLTGGC